MSQGRAYRKIRNELESVKYEISTLIKAGAVGDKLFPLISKRDTLLWVLMVMVEEAEK